MLVSPDVVLENNSWAMIKAVSKKGKASQIWSIGDTKEIILNGNVNGFNISDHHLNVFIIEFENFGDVTKTSFQIGKSNNTFVALIDNAYFQRVSSYFYLNLTMGRSTIGGWVNGGVYSACGKSGSIRDLIPSDLDNVIDECNFYYENVISSRSSEFVVDKRYFYLLSEYEIFGSTTHANPKEKEYMKQIVYYKNGNYQIPKVYDDLSRNAITWLRSPRFYNSTTYQFCSTSERTYNGTFYDGDYSLGISPVFCV